MLFPTQLVASSRMLVRVNSHHGHARAGEKKEKKEKAGTMSGRTRAVMNKVKNMYPSVDLKLPFSFYGVPLDTKPLNLEIGVEFC